MADLDALATFVAVARAGSFAAAARRLGLSPAMVGRRVRALEERHGARLIERTTRSLRLTELGQAFLPRAAAILEAVEDLSELARPGEGRLSGRVRLSGPVTLGVRRLAGIVARLVERWPELTVELTLTDRKVDLVGEGYDLAVRVGELRPSGLVARRVGTYGFACCAAPAFLDRHGAPATPGELGRLRCVLNLNMSPRDRWPFLDAEGRPVAAEVRGPLEIGQDEAQRMAALEGAGVIYVPRDLVQEDLDAGRLVEVLAGWPRPVMPIHAVHPSRRLVPRRVSALVEAIAQGLREGPAPPAQSSGPA